jgi:HEAT repeat protein
MGRHEAARSVAIYGEWKTLRGTHDRTSLKAMAMATLWQGLQTPSAKVKISAIQTAEQLDLSPLAEPVAEKMGDDNAAVAAAAAVALLRSHPDAPYVATEALSSDDPRARAIAVEGIARKIGQDARADLVPLLKDPDPQVRRATVRAVWKMATRDDIELISKLARRDDHGSVRAAALGVLANKDFPGVAAVARAAIRDSYLGARLAALRLLDRRGGKSAADDFIVLATGDDLFLALRAAVALAKRGDAERTLRIARRALASKQWTVRAAALNAIAEVADKKTALPLIRAAVADESVRVRLAAGRALVRFGDKAAAGPVFAEALGAPTDGVRIQAAVDLVRLEDARGREALAELARATSPATRVQAVRALHQIGAPSDALVNALADESAEVRIVAADVLLTLVP